MTRSLMRRTIILISYAVMMTVVLVGTIILVEFGQGYSYDFKSRSFIINGLLSLVSSPAQAELIVNGKAIHRSTPYRATLQAGSYDLELRKAGFRTWHKQVDIKPFEVLNLESVFLVPNNIDKQTLASGQVISQLVASRDRKHFAFTTTQPTVAVWVLDTNHAPSTKVYTAAPATADRAAETITAVSWSDDGSHLLIQSNVGGVNTYNLVSANGGAPLNLTDVFKLDLTGLRFSPYAWQELYWNSPEGLRKLNAGDRTTSAVLASAVAGFGFARERIVYVHTTELGQSVWSMDRSGNDQKQLIESLAASSSYQMEYSHYRGLDVLAILPQSSSVATVYEDVFSTNPVSKVVSKAATHLDFSDNGRYLAFYNDKTFGTYDLEKNALQQAPKQSGAITCLSWFDVAHVVLCRDAEVDVAELDGANMTAVGTTAAGIPVFGGSDLRHVYVVGPAANGKNDIMGLRVRS